MALNSSSSYKQNWINSLSHKTKRKSCEHGKGLIKRREVSLTVGRSSERVKEWEQSKRIVYVNEIEKNEFNDKFIYLASIDFSFCSKHCSRIGGLWTWAEPTLTLRSSCVNSNLKHTRATACFAYACIPWVHFLCSVLSLIQKWTLWVAFGSKASPPHLVTPAFF